LSKELTDGALCISGARKTRHPNRIKDHLSQSYREKDTNKAFYIAMEKSGAVTSFICLARYPMATPIAQVLLTEAVCCSIFGTSKSKIDCGLRLKELPKVN
jgi:hypothetical protein